MFVLPFLALHFKKSCCCCCDVIFSACLMKQTRNSHSNSLMFNVQYNYYGSVVVQVHTAASLFVAR